MASTKAYQLSQTSPFYDAVVGPLCDKVVSYLPDWVDPDVISVLGLLSTIVSYLLLAYSEGRWWMTALAALVYMFYPICDNCDGKQARRLKRAGPWGEFLDHAMDCLTISFTAFVVIYVVDPSTRFYGFHVAMVPPHLIFWTSHVFHELTGRLPLGFTGQAQSGLMSLARYLTVDEGNFIAVPSLVLIRALYQSGAPCPLAWPVTLPGPVASILGVSSASTFELLPIFAISVTLVGILAGTFFSSHMRLTAVPMLLPVYGHIAALVLLKPPTSWLPPVFGIMCMEFIRGRIVGKPMRGVYRTLRGMWPSLLWIALKYSPLSESSVSVLLYSITVMVLLIFRRDFKALSKAE